jgi:hypothetical protein
MIHLQIRYCVISISWHTQHDGKYVTCVYQGYPMYVYTQSCYFRSNLYLVNMQTGGMCGSDRCMLLFDGNWVSLRVFGCLWPSTLRCSLWGGVAPISEYSFGVPMNVLVILTGDNWYSYLESWYEASTVWDVEYSLLPAATFSTGYGS